MKIFGKNKLKPFWSFSQNGNIWRFIFGGNKFIVGETRDNEKKTLNFFTLDYTTGKTHLKNFIFETDNYWVAIEGATEKAFFLGRIEKPELPYQKNIIALDILTGNKLWENEIYSYLFNTEDIIYGIRKGFENNQIAELDLNTGEVKKILTDEEHLQVFELRNANEDYIYENSNYPIVYNKDESDILLKNVFDEICYKENEIGSIEYIQKASLLIFNFYIKLTSEENSKAQQYYENRFIVYDTESGEIRFEDVLNKTTNYCVPDNFFTKNNYLFYLKEKKELHCIKLN